MFNFLRCIRAADSDADGPSRRNVALTRTVAYVELIRLPEEPLGMVIAGGADRGCPIFIEVLRPGGVGERTEALQEGDQILAINGTPTDHLTHQEAASLLQNAGSVINLEIAFDGPPDGTDLEGLTSKIVIVCLRKEGNNSFGFTIRGGRTERRLVTVAHVRQSSSVYRQGTLKVGDRILKINGVDVREATQAEALALLRACNNQLTLEIEFDVTVHDELTTATGPLLVEMVKPIDVPLGITLSGSSEPGDPVWISSVRDAGVADRSGALHPGDRLLSINGTTLEQAAVEDAVQLLSQSGIVVRVEIAPHHLFTVRPGFNQEVCSDYSGMPWQHSLAPSPVLSNGSLNGTLQSINDSTHLLSHPETVGVELRADAVGFGFSLQGGATHYSNNPLVIESTAANGPAERLGQIQAGDRVREINGFRTDGLALQQASKLIRESGDSVNMEMEFDVADSVVPTSGTFDVRLMKYGGSLGITINGNAKPGDPIWINRLKKGGVAYRIGSLKPGDVLLAINGRSLGNATLQDAAELLKTSTDVVTLTVSKDIDFGLHMDNLAYTVELSRQPGERWGLRLNGSEEPGRKVVISEIRRDGAAARSGALRVGDCLVSINGVSLVERNMIEVLQLLQQAGDMVVLKISKQLRTKHRSSGKHTRSPKVTHNSHHYGHSEGQQLRHAGLDGPPSLDTPPSHTPSRSHLEQYDTDEGSEHRGSSPLDPELRGSSPLDPSLAAVQELLRSQLPPRLLGNTASHIKTEEDQSALSEEGDGTAPQGSSDGMGPQGNVSSSGGVTSSHGSVVSSCGGPNMHVQSVAVGQVSKDARLVPGEGHEVAAKCGVLPTGRESWSETNSDADDTGREILKDIEQAVLKSSAFIKEFSRLADSGSSDPDSDNDRRSVPYHRKQHHHTVPPRMAHKFMEQVKQIATPTPVEIHTVHLVKTEEHTDFGFSVSDGLVEPGVFVRTVKQGGLADLSGKLAPFDRILKINHHVVKDLDCKGAVPILAGAGDEVTLVISRNPFANKEWDEEV